VYLDPLDQFVKHQLKARGDVPSDVERVQATFLYLHPLRSTVTSL
jgi:hypothetical protein